MAPAVKHQKNKANSSRARAKVVRFEQPALESDESSESEEIEESESEEEQTVNEEE